MKLTNTSFFLKPEVLVTPPLVHKLKDKLVLNEIISEEVKEALLKTSGM